MRESSVVYDPDPKKRLKNEEERATKLLKGQIVKKIQRFAPANLVIEFEDGARFYVDIHDAELNLSITGDFDEEK